MNRLLILGAIFALLKGMDFAAGQLNAGLLSTALGVAGLVIFFFLAAMFADPF